MEYAVYMKLVQYGCTHVQADSEAEAIEKARKMYNDRQIDWYDEDLIDLSAEPE